MDVNIQTQPDDETCGPTSLQAVYRYYHDNISLDQVISEVQRLRNGGTLACLLGKHAMGRGYEAKLYVYNLDIFDPSWFDHRGNAVPDIIEKLILQSRYSTAKSFLETTDAYIQYLKAGGKLFYKELSTDLLKSYFTQKKPIITGLSATYLYQTPRERQTSKGKMIYDDIRGEPCGHFVVLCGYDEKYRHIVVADPHRTNPISNNNYYKVSIKRLMNAIMLGVLTFDANLLVITPKGQS
ncbi:MAG: peptidase-C39 like family protein [Gammaproteobacteria bacterium CG11_big_fil_rev_8_21_14_0_20_46_22]|nr:MAG: peptidase-C39 like family protein [Gammaproteobacteria bacterium CG12_big_fil_rev_8_21_14_0_65_46_12]PIR10868.1 MAG: peptidase-C39 like family protein [Gammaproteobacteria bacterium CG11_big_fil_rev_8_21_14_0_20_46_22]